MRSISHGNQTGAKGAGAPRPGHGKSERGQWREVLGVGRKGGSPRLPNHELPELLVRVLSNSRVSVCLRGFLGMEMACLQGQQQSRFDAGCVHVNIHTEVIRVLHVETL